jgi:hypothetical protein
MDRALLEIARAAEVDLAAEDFTRLDHMSLYCHNRPLGEVLKDTERQLQLAHFWVGSTLVLRARDWPYAVDHEPLAGLIDLWEREEHDHGFLPLGDYLDAATALDDAQIAMLRNHRDERGMLRWPMEAVRLLRNRHMLRGFAALDGERREQMFSAEGLPLLEAAVAQPAAWQRVLLRFALFPRSALSAARVRAAPPESPDIGVPTVYLTGIPGMEPVTLTR